MAEFASKGVATAGLTTGIIGTAGWLLNGGLGNLLGGLGGNNAALMSAMACSDNQPVSRYEMKMENELAKKDSEIALLKADKYTDEKITEVYERLSSRIRGVEDQVAAQAVYNATNTATLSCIQAQVAQLQGLTKLVIPITSVCPEPMARYNSWSAPTASTTETPAA